MTARGIPTIVVVTLSIISVGGLAIMGYLAMTQTPIPDQIDRLTVGAMSALAAILATTRAISDPPTSVVGPGGGPVITEEAPLTSSPSSPASPPLTAHDL